jgi:broad specificity phosphatase PhoE
MSSILLIRHGQASFGTHDYDRLSELGGRQSEVLGRHLQQLGHRFDAMYAGRLSRQQKTAALARAQMPDAGLPPLLTDPAFDEYDADGLFRAYLPRVLRENPELAANAAQLLSNRALFQQAFIAVTRCWLEGVPAEGQSIEPWEMFHLRVREGLARISATHGRDAQVAVFTSGGAIGVSVATALELTPARTLQVNWGVYNASITELKYRRSGPFLVGFNNITHLKLAGDPALITHR